MSKEKPGKKEWRRITVYLSEAEKKMVERQAKEAGLSVEAYIRHLLSEDFRRR